MSRVVFTDDLDLLAPIMERLHEIGVSAEALEPGIRSEEAAARAKDAEVVVLGTLPFRAQHIAMLRKTRLLIRAGIGYDIIDVEAATRRGIWVANVPDYCTGEVADHTTLLLLAAVRSLPELVGRRGAGAWVGTDDLPPIHRIARRRLGIIGFGRIGRLVASRSLTFGWEVVVYDPFVPEEDVRLAGATPLGVEELFATAHAITLHCPLTPESRLIVNARRLAAIRPGLVLVNTSRGELVDLDALDAAIGRGRVAAVALDVLQGEPFPDLGHPLLARPQVLVTPHLAWYSVEAQRELALRVGDEALRYLAGKPPRNLVNPKARSTPRNS